MWVCYRYSALILISAVNLIAVKELKTLRLTKQAFHEKKYVYAAGTKADLDFG